MSEYIELSKRLDDTIDRITEIHEDVGIIREDVKNINVNITREITVLTASMAALQRRQIEKQASWSRFIEVISAASFVVSTAVALFVALH